MIQLIPAVHSNDHVLGNGGALLELVEYGDYECPHCGRAYPIIKDILQQIGGEVNFVFRNFPLAQIHKHAFVAAVATEAAGQQGKFWEMHDLVFENQRALDIENLFGYADAIELDLERFRNDIQQEKLANKVESDFESGIRSGVNGTPTFFINGKKYNGSWDGDLLLQYLKKELAGGAVSKG